MRVCAHHRHLKTAKKEKSRPLWEVCSPSKTKGLRDLKRISEDASLLPVEAPPSLLPVHQEHWLGPGKRQEEQLAHPLWGEGSEHQKDSRT